jgi:maltose-binding protein MalE
MMGKTAAAIARPAIGALGHALVVHASTVTSGKTSMPTSNQVTTTGQDDTSYEDIIADLINHFEITVKIYILNDDKWDADNKFPGHNTPGNERIVFKDAEQQMRTEYTTNGGAEVRILVIDEEDEIIGAMSGGLNKRGQIRKETTYGTVSN